METSCHLNPIVGRTVVPISPTPKTRLSNKMKVITCAATKLSLQGDGNNFYQVLSLGSQNVGLDEIKKAYRKLALQCHPDLAPPSQKEEATKKFFEMQKAYETLSDPVLRTNYDRQLCLGCSTDSEGSKQSSNVGWENQLIGLRVRSIHGMVKERNRNIGSKIMGDWKSQLSRLHNKSVEKMARKKHDCS